MRKALLGVALALWLAPAAHAAPQGSPGCAADALARRLRPGPFCAWRTCSPHELTFHDAARGLAAYTVDGELHLLRTADGTDSVLAPASIGRFIDGGLVYADGSRLRLVPSSQLPLRAF